MTAPQVTIAPEPAWQAHSAEVSRLMAAFSKAQAEFGPIKKTKTANAGTYTYDYADLADILDVVRGPLCSNGLSLSTTIDDDKRLTTWLYHESGEWMRSMLSLGDYSRPQDLGIDITYSRRYMLSALLGIATEEDTDGQGTAEETKPAATTKPRKKPPAPPRQPKPQRQMPPKADPPAQKQSTSEEKPPDDGDRITDAQRKKLWTTLRNAGKALSYDDETTEALLRQMMETQKMGGEKHSTNMLTKKEASMLIEQIIKLEQSNTPPPLSDEPEPGSQAAKDKVFD